jgi:NAD(P)-dependent dehydrogenase (short-subunit alcohol dehydrogenase family)
VHGRIVLVTGANSGIGKETAVGLARRGARVVMTARDPLRGEAALEEVRRRAGSDAVDLLMLDLASLAGVRDAAAEFLARYERLDVLVNNAGLILGRRQVTVDGFEMTFAVNHLGPLLLTSLLLDRLRASAPARIVNVTSAVHRSVRRLDPDDLVGLVPARRYRPMEAYARSKLANIWFTVELARRLEGTGVTANAVHPGSVRSGFGRDGDLGPLMAAGMRLAAPFMKSAARGARGPIHLASAPELEGVTGRYFNGTRPRTPSRLAQDPDAARRLWELSERLCGLAT